MIAKKQKIRLAVWIAAYVLCIALAIVSYASAGEFADMLLPSIPLYVFSCILAIEIIDIRVKKKARQQDAPVLHPEGQPEAGKRPVYKPGCLILLILLLLPVAVFFIVNACMDGPIAAFQPHIPEYAQVKGGGEARWDEPVKAVVIKAEDKDAPENYAFDYLYYKLPLSLRAQTPDEVNAIIKICRYGMIIGIYYE